MIIIDKKEHFKNIFVCVGGNDNDLRSLCIGVEKTYKHKLDYLSRFKTQKLQMPENFITGQRVIGAVARMNKFFGL